MSGFYELNPPKRDIAATHWSHIIADYMPRDSFVNISISPNYHVIAISPFVRDRWREGESVIEDLMTTVIYQFKSLPVPIAEEEEDDVV